MEVLRRVIPALLPAAPSWWRVQLDGVDLLVALGIGVAAALGAGLYPAIRVAQVSVDPLLREGQRETGLAHHPAGALAGGGRDRALLGAAHRRRAGDPVRREARDRRRRRPHGGVPARPGDAAAALRLRRPAHLHPRPGGAPPRPSPASRPRPSAPRLPGITAPWRPLYQLADRGGQRSEELPSATVVNVGPGFFETFRIPILQGRAFLDSDNDYRLTVVVVSESMARAAWPGESPIGKVIRIAPQETWLPSATVVGVAKDVRYDEELQLPGPDAAGDLRARVPVARPVGGHGAARPARSRRPPPRGSGRRSGSSTSRRRCSRFERSTRSGSATPPG